MAKRLSVHSKHVQLKIIGSAGTFLASRVQRFSANATQPVNTVDELGNPNHVGTSYDTPDVTITFQAMDVGIKFISVLTGQDATAFPGAGVNITTGDNAFGYLDLVAYVKDEDVSDYIKTIHLRRCTIQSFTFNYTVDGDSTEEYTAIGSEKRYFSRDVVVESWGSGDAGVGPFSLTYSPIELKSGNSVLSIIADGVYFSEDTTGTPGSNEYYYDAAGPDTILLGTAFANNLLIVYQANPAGDNWSDVSDTDVPSAIRGRDVKIYLDDRLQERVQSVSITGNFNPTAIKELGNRDVVGYRSNIPEVTGTITVLDTDTEITEIFLVGEYNSGDTEFQVGACTISGVPLEIQLVDPTDCTPPYTIKKTVYLPSIVITSEGYASNVNDNATQTFDWRSETGAVYVYSGAKP